MAVRDVIRFPDERLKAVCTPLRGHVAGADIERIAADLIDTMGSYPGCVGIAAPQIGELVRMVVIDARGHRKTQSCHGLQVLVDPVLEQQEGSVRMREGCLSIPDLTGDVTRAEQVIVSALTPAGTSVRLECDAYEARIVLHELDHLDGVLFLDRVASARDVHPRKRYQ